MTPNPQAHTAQAQTVSAPDGYALRVNRFSPQQVPKATVVISAAMGAAQEFYHPFASWLSRQGFEVYCFDYRGMEKGTGNVKTVDTDITTWMLQDANAVLKQAKAHAPGRLIWLGHSLGCQIVGTLPDRHLIDQMAGIATGTGYWLHADWALKSKAWLLWLVMVPTLTPLFGYFPGSTVKMVADLPARVAYQWRRWCLNRYYLVGVEGEAIRAQYQALRLPFKVLSFTDDELMSARNTDDIFEMYPQNRIDHRRLDPAEVQLKGIGHFGFFRKSMEQTVWPLALSLLEE